MQICYFFQLCLEHSWQDICLSTEHILYRREDFKINLLPCAPIPIDQPCLHVCSNPSYVFFLSSNSNTLFLSNRGRPNRFYLSCSWPWFDFCQDRFNQEPSFLNASYFLPRTRKVRIHCSTDIIWSCFSTLDLDNQDKSCRAERMLDPVPKNRKIKKIKLLCTCI